MPLAEALLATWLAASYTLTPSPIALQALGEMAQAQAVAVSPAGLELDIERVGTLVVPLRGATTVELDLRSSGELTLVALNAQGQTTDLQPFRRLAIRPGANRVRVDLRLGDHWSPSNLGAVQLIGTGHVTVTAMRAAGPPPGSTEAAVDEAMRWSALPIVGPTINGLTPLLLSLSRDLYLHDLLGWSFVAGALLLLFGWRWRGGRWRPREAVGAAALASAAATGLIFVIRIAPAANLRPRPSVEERLVQDLPLEPRQGALAVAARQVLPASARVGVLADDDDWYGYELTCYLLAPRRCVRYRPGQARLEGSFGIDVLDAAAVDALVVVSTDQPLPAGFAPVATLSPRDLVARRSP